MTTLFCNCSVCLVVIIIILFSFWRTEEEYNHFYIVRTFARKFSNVDFFLKILSLKHDELVMSEMWKKWGVNDDVLERTFLEEHVNLSKLGFVNE